MSWQGCYEEGWKGEIVPAAFAHPAKFSRSLIRRIYGHAFAEGWLQSSIKLIVTRELLEYILCQGEPIPALDVGKVPDMPTVSNAPELSMEKKRLQAAQEGNAPLVESTLPLCNLRTDNSVPPNVSIIETAERKNFLVSLAENELSDTSDGPEDTAQQPAIVNPCLEISERQGNIKPMEPINQTTLELAEPLIGNGEAVSVGNITELNGRKIANESAKRLEPVNPVEPREGSKFTTKSRIDIVTITADQTWRFYALPVTEKLISVLIGQYPKFSLNGKSMLVVRGPRNLHVGDTLQTEPDTILDPFAGVALGALDATWNGLNWVGVELEPKFVNLGQQNIELWQRKYGSKEGFGSGRIIQGDSRKLAEVIAGADLVCSSPPFSDSLESKDKKFNAKARPGRTIQKADYGSSPGQLGAMKEGDFDCVVGSPPYAGSVNADSHGIDWTKAGPATGNRKRGAGTKHEATLCAQLSYGQSEGQLASLPEGRFEAVISSPPYEASLTPGNKGGPEYEQRRKEGMKRSGSSHTGGGQLKYNARYSFYDDNLGNSSGDTFWSAAREILIQCHMVLKPGGHAIWVCKDFVRKGKRIPFSDQWQALCESVGFRLVCRHKAMLVKNHGEQSTIFGPSEQLTTERKSFFRRLTEKKGSPAIDWEDVLCFSRSAAEDHHGP